jgi:hypothetical protein
MKKWPKKQNGILDLELGSDLVKIRNKETCIGIKKRASLKKSFCIKLILTESTNST